MKKFLLSVAAAFAVAIAAYIIISSQIFLPLSNTVSDAFYQKPQTPDSRIVIIGIDDKALDAYGNLPWDRDVLAQAISTLNSSENEKPAVIGIDLLLSDESENDDYLLEVCENSNNVVMASHAVFGTELINENASDFHLNTYFVEQYEPPFNALSQLVMQGHVNAMIDTDGILRHSIWQIELQNGEIIPSFSRVIAQHYLIVNEEGELKAPVTDSRHRWYVVQQASPGGYYDNKSVLDLINGDIDPSYYEDKIVLIGPYAVGLQDNYDTPISNTQKMYGVEYQANAISALLNEKTVFQISLEFTNALTCAVIFFFALYCFRRKFMHAVLALVLSNALWFISALLLFNEGYMLQVFYYPFFSIIVFVIFVGINYTYISMEKAKVAKTFERYVAPQVVKELLSEDENVMQLGGKIADIAVMFADIREFTSLTEKLAPKKSVEIVNSYLSMFSECVFESEGTLDKFIGDCIMAFWGAPLAQKDSCHKAALTAINILKQTQGISKRFKQELGFEIEVGIGIAFGAAVVGNIGGGKRLDYTVIGDTVNTASRLEGAVPGGQIYIDKNMADSLKGIFKTQLVPGIKLKGKSENFEVYRLLFDD